MRFPHFALAILAVTLPSSTLAVALPTKRADVCNGKPELCGRSYGNVTFVGAHDSFAFSKDPLAVSRDQEVDILSQLKLGVRMLQAQAHDKDGELHFCHTSCLLFDGGKVVDYLKFVKTFLDQNPNEVLTLLFTNPENISLKDKWLPAFNDAGITDLAFIPPNLPVKRNEWPTLGEMIGSGKRVVVFMDANADPAQVNFILPEFDMIWETPFSVTDDKFPCKVDRISGPLSPEDHMHLINHSLNKDVLGTGVIVSDRLSAATTNGLDSINANVAGCAQFAAGKAPNFLLLDWVDVGEGFKAADKLNGF